MPKLHFSQPEFAALSCALPEGATKVGRSPRNALVLTDASVSADHCEILVSWDEVIVLLQRHLGGRVRVVGQRPVNHGELIRFGRVEARLELDGFPTEDATAMTANFGVSRVAPAQPAPEPPRVVIGNGPPAPAGGGATVSLPEPARPVSPTVIVTAESPRSAPVPHPGRPNPWWRVVLLVVAAVVVVGWLLRTFR